MGAQEISASRRGYLLPTNVIEGIIAYFPEEVFPTWKPFIHEYIYQSRQKFSVLRLFRFDSVGGHPYSADIDDALTNMELAGLLSQKNPSFTEYLISSALREHFSHYTKLHFSSEQMGEIEELAKGLKNNLNCSSRDKNEQL